MQEHDYENIPENILYETKRTVLDSLGAALGSPETDKGRIGVAMARKMGGVPQSTLLCKGGKYSAAVAAFANAEILNGLDMDAIPHIPPITLPAMLAVAEANQCTGKEFISAFTLAEEINQRLFKYSNIMYAPVSGNSNQFILGTALGNAKLLKLDDEKMRNALGIAAYYCSLPVSGDWDHCFPKPMVKYFPASWLAMGSVMAADLAKEGYTGSQYVLDSEYGWSKFYIRGEGKLPWEPDVVVRTLGDEWWSPVYHFKPYPCCRVMHSALDCVFDILGQHPDIKPDDIAEVKIYNLSSGPSNKNVKNDVDIQFSTEFCTSMAIYGIKPGPVWQEDEVLADKRLHDFSQKVFVFGVKEYAEERKTNDLVWHAQAEFYLKSGEVYSAETRNSRGTNTASRRLSDKELAELFRSFASKSLSKDKIEKSIDIIMNLEKYDSLDELFNNLAG
jgi:2-methylcitrate dehydratase PrpD